MNTPKLILQGHEYTETKTRQRYYQKKIYRSLSLMNTDTKILNKKYQQSESNNIVIGSHTTQLGFTPGMQGFFNICKPISMIHHINKQKNKSHTIISTNSGKAFNKIQHLFMIKTLQKVGREGTYLNIIKAIYDKPIVNILNGKKLKVLPLRFGT